MSHWQKAKLIFDNAQRKGSKKSDRFSGKTRRRDSSANRLQKGAGKYVVTNNNPHYPDVEYCDTLRQAKAKRDEWLDEMSSPDGEYECKTTIALVIETHNVRSDY